MCSNV
jgi:hypothetical protein